jgi:hypothetical protein
MQAMTGDPAWLPLLNAIQKDWRDHEILKGHDPDPLIEERLRETGKWPMAPHAPAKHKTPRYL